ncbi:hypothetical protein ACVRWB_07440 [Streptococcus troglodytae]
MFSNLRKKKSKEEYKKSQQAIGSCLICIGGLLLVLSLSVSMSDFAAGFLIGISICMNLLGVIVFARVATDKTLTHYYIAAYDERNKRIRSLTAQLTLAILMLLMVALVVLYAFWHIAFSYLITLMILLYGTIICGILLRVFFNRLL